MADSKISSLPSVTLPLAGTEVFPIVQSGVTKKVSASNFLIGLSVPRTLASNGIPFVYVSSGTMGNNGALSGLTAVANIYPNAYVRLPANAISSGSSAGWYYAVFSSTTAATVYNNTYTTGQPTIPTSPTAFVTTGPGSYTQSTGNYITVWTITIPANTLGVTGNIMLQQTQTTNNTVNARFYLNEFSGTNINGPLSLTSATNDAQIILINSRGTTSAQVSKLISRQNTMGGSSIQTTLDMTASQTLNFKFYLGTATDTFTAEQFSIVVSP